MGLVGVLALVSTKLLISFHSSPVASEFNSLLSKIVEFAGYGGDVINFQMKEKDYQKEDL